MFPYAFVARIQPDPVRRRQCCHRRARVRRSEDVEAIIGNLNDQSEADPLHDEDEII